MAQTPLLFKNVRVIDPKSSLHQKQVHLLLRSEHIEVVDEANFPSDALTFEGENLCVSPGWMDIGAVFGDPGFEHTEDLESGLQAAMQGGYTTIALSPYSQPVLDNKTGVEYVMNLREEHFMDILPLGSFSKNLEGQELTELYDMAEAGAIGFSHAHLPLRNIQLLKLALQYNKVLGIPLLLPSFESYLSNGYMHEGLMSTQLGLKGIPDISETIALSRDIELAKYCEAAVHFQSISSAAGLKLLRKAQDEGLICTADASIMHLYFTDFDLSSYNTNLKLMPPVRAAEDQNALLQALKDGTISHVSSQHFPQDVEQKKCEFDHAAFGAISLEAVFGALGHVAGEHISTERMVELLAYGPREVLGLEIPHIEDGAEANLSFFDPTVEWTFGTEHLASKSRNSPFIGKPMKGRALGIFNRATLAWHEE